MARTLEFDYADAIERATRLFWETGYTNTSLRELLNEMGIGEGSFYNTLKSKKNAYLECLRHYNATVGLRRVEAFFSAPTAALGVRALFKNVLDCFDDADSPSRVCLFSGTLTHEVLADPDLRSYVEAQMTEWSGQLSARLTAGKAAGQLPPDFAVELVVPIIVTYLQGLFRMALVSYDRPRLEKQIEVFLTGLRL